MDELNHAAAPQNQLSTIALFGDRIALGLCGFGFMAAIFLTSLGWFLEINTLPLGILIFLFVQAIAFGLGLLTRRQSLGRSAMIASGISLGLGLMAALILFGVMISNRVQSPSEVSTATFDGYVQTVRQAAAPANSAYPVASSRPSTGFRSVVINSIRLTDAQVAQIEQAYGTRVPDGRYWVDSFGYFGYEGGPALGNLGAAAVPYGSGAGNGGGAIRKGPLTSRDVTGISVYDLR